MRSVIANARAGTMRASTAGRGRWAAVVLAVGLSGCEPSSPGPEPTAAQQAAQAPQAPTPQAADPPQDAARQAAAAEVPPAEEQAGHGAASPEPAGDVQTLGDHGLQILTTADACSVRVTSSGAPPADVPLALKPPCYFLRWPYPLPANPAESGGRARGAKDGPMAWEYAMSGEPTTVAIVIGGPPSTTDPARLRKLEEARCGERIQGLRLGVRGVEASVRVATGSSYCELGGADEKEFWLFAHER